MTEYTSKRYIDGKIRQIIVDESGNIINRNPNKDELKDLDEEQYVRNIIPKTIHHNRTNTCDRCGINFDKAFGKPHRERDREGNWTGKWDCQSCWQKFDPFSSHSIMRSLRNRRTGNQNPDHSVTIGDQVQKLVNTLRNFIDLNIKDDNYNSPIDSIDPITGLKYQIKGKLYNSRNGQWTFAELEKEWEKEYHSVICVCISRDENTIDRLYEFPKSETIKRSISIVKYDSKGRLYKNGWYEKYRIKDEGELKKANEIWKALRLIQNNRR